MLYFSIQVRTRGLPDDHVGPIRVVTIETIDSNMCCGTHVSTISHLQVSHVLEARPPPCFFSSRGRLSLSSGHRQNGNRQWQPLLIAITVVAFFPPLICIHKQTKKTGSATAGTVMGSGSHCRSPFGRWPELKLGW